MTNNQSDKDGKSEKISNSANCTIVPIIIIGTNYYSIYNSFEYIITCYECSTLRAGLSAELQGY